MKLVIDIPEEVFDEIYNKNYYSLKGKEALRLAVRDSTTLPKGHGRLIDAKQAEERIRHAFDEHEGYNSLARYIVRNPSETHTIIEADKEGK